MRLPIKSAIAFISASFVLWMIVLWIVGVPLLRLCRVNRLSGYLAGAVVITAFSAIVIFQPLAGGRLNGRVRIAAWLPLLALAAGLNRARGMLIAPFSSHTSEGRRCAGVIII